jgi:PAS domain S-box-containing protein
MRQADEVFYAAGLGMRRSGWLRPAHVTYASLNPHPKTLIDSEVVSAAAGTSELPSFEVLLAAMVVERSDNAIIGLTPGGLIKTWNHGAELLYGYAAAEAVGKHVSMLLVSERQHEFAELLAAAGDRVTARETLRRRKDGRPIDVSVIVSTIQDPTGRVIGAATIDTEITERKRLEGRAQRALSDLEAVQRVAGVGSWSWDPQSSRSTWSQQVYELLGRDPSRRPATGGELLDYVHVEDRERVTAACAQALGAGRELELDCRIIAGDGVERELHTSGRVDPDRAGCYVGTVQDVTEQRRATPRAA